MAIAYFDARGTVLFFDYADAETDNSDYSIGPNAQALFFLKVDTVPQAPCLSRSTKMRHHE